MSVLRKAWSFIDINFGKYLRKFSFVLWTLPRKQAALRLIGLPSSFARFEYLLFNFTKFILVIENFPELSFRSYNLSSLTFDYFRLATNFFRTSIENLSQIIIFLDLIHFLLNLRYYELRIFIENWSWTLVQVRVKFIFIHKIEKLFNCNLFYLFFA